jgi:hypothetical protein
VALKRELAVKAMSREENDFLNELFFFANYARWKWGYTPSRFFVSD